MRGIAICDDDPPCSGRGTCIEPNMCACDVGWSPPLCDECADGFQPPNCNQCTPGLALPDCQTCVGSHLKPPSCVECLDGTSPLSLSFLPFSDFLDLR